MYLQSLFYLITMVLWMVIYLYLIKNESDISMDVYNAHACTYSLNEFVM